MFLPGFDRDTQLGMEFTTIAFGTAWLRRTFTNEHDPTVLSCLAETEHAPRERRLAQVRYGNNITLLLKACYFLRDFHGPASFWTAISHAFGVRYEMVEFAANLFVEARAIYLSNHSTPSHSVQFATEATYWTDKWASFLDERRHPLPARDSQAFAAADDFFENEKARNGDLACVLSKAEATVPPSAPRALRKRSPSPTASQGTPNAKRRANSRSTDESVYDPSTGRNRTQSSVAGSRPSCHPKQEPHETTDSQNRQSRRKSHEEPYFELKLRGQGQKDHRSPPSYRDRLSSEADGYEALAQSNIELQDRVHFLEKERLEAARAQSDRDYAIRALQAKFAAFEKTSAVADSQSSLNDRFIREMTIMGKKLNTQAEKLHKLEKQLELSNQAAQRMEATLFSIQKNVPPQPQHTDEEAGLATAETKPREEGAPATTKKDISEMRTKIMSLEAKSVLLNDLHKTVREMKEEIAAQKDKVADPVSDPTNEEFKQDTSASLTSVKEDIERQGQALQEMNNRVVALKDQATVCNARIASLEARPDTAEYVSRLDSRVSTMEEKQAERNLAVEHKFGQVLEVIERMQRSLDDPERVRALTMMSQRISGVQTRIASIQQHETETSKRLDDMEVSQDALKLHDQSSRIDELSQSLESLKKSLLDLSRSDDVDLLRAEIHSLSQKEAFASQEISQCEDDLVGAIRMVESLSKRVTRLDDMYEKYVTQCHKGPGQPFHAARDTFQNGNQNDVPAVIDSLCKRVFIMENGFQILRDVMSIRRR